MKKALIVVDVQNDFCEGGSMGVEGGAAVAGAISEYIEEHHSDFAAIAATADWHIDPGSHFSDDPDFVDSWPVHCVADSEGAEPHPDFETDRIEAWFHKGEYEAAYSGFEGVQASEISTPLGAVEEDDDDAAEHENVSLDDWLREREIEAVEVVGIATDYCVRATALDAAANGYETTVLVALTAAVAEESAQRALQEMRDAGIEIIPAR